MPPLQSRLARWRLLLIVMVGALLIGRGHIEGVHAADGAADIRVGHFPNITHGQAIYARATGSLEKAGLRIRWSTFNAGPSAIEALFANGIDIVFIGPSPTINGFVRSRGEKFVIVAGAASGGAGLVIRSDVRIQSERDFDGKIIATPQLGNTQDVAARSWFGARGYKLKEKGGNLTLLALSNPDQLTMLRKREIDGAWTVEPWLSRLELEANAKVFLEESSLWPQGRYVTTHVIVSRAFLSSRPADVRRFLLALVDITQQMNADKKATATVLNAELKKETGKALPEPVVQKALTRVEFTWDPIPSSLFESAAAAHRIGLIKREPVLKGIYALEILNQILAERNLPTIHE